MDPNWRPAVQVAINAYGQVYGPNEQAQQRQTRPLAVDEALQYSPMSSAPVFGLGTNILFDQFDIATIADSFSLLDCVLRPDIGRPSSTTSINHILQAGRSALSDLDSDIRSGTDEPSRLDTSREYLQQLLDGDQLTEL